ncbi:activating signal cointegrator 1 complex subunit 3-like [Watersipora subatra]|uniref:activating signal cointegrator 1 complex subunit 3-like n=1 Tax=Watersipora subatra TaxID=2589382 RepID=UPI00355C73E5
MATQEHPRLTTALRTFADLSIRYETPSPSEYKFILAKKKRIHAEALLNSNNPQWNEISKIAQSFEKPADISRALREILKATKLLVGDEVSSDLLQSSAAFLFQFFMLKTEVSASDTLELQKKLGHHSKADAQLVCDLVQKVVSQLDESQLERFTSKLRIRSLGFGEKFKVNLPEYVDFSQVQLPPKRLPLEKNIDISYQPRQQVPQPKPSKMAAGWLRSQLESRIPSSSGLSIGELCAKIFDILSSVNGDDFIQNELFDLLGFEHFELIQELLTKRRDIVDSMLQTPASIASTGSLHSRDQIEKKPNYGAQIIIQSESERGLIKKINKEEKKLNRRLDKSSNSATENQSSLVLDTDHLKAIRKYRAS